MPPSGRPLTLSRAGILATIGTFVVVVVCARLGFWQLDRLEQKQERNAAAHARAALPPVRLGSATRDTAGMIFRRAIVTGVYDDARTIIVAGRSFRGTPGVYVLTPLRIGGSAVFINRGFTRSADAAHVDVERLREPAPDSLEGLITYLGHDENEVAADRGFKRVWYRPSIAQLRAQSPYPVADYVVQLLPAPGAPESPVRLPAPDLDEGPHLGYAIQWFSFAGIFVVGWVAMVFRRKKGGV